jgi:YlmC/YmxH family sporulation protein
MRLSQLTGKEVINLSDGAKLGTVDECELAFDGKTGRIETMLLPYHSRFFDFLSENKLSTIPWEAIRQIGDEVIIVDLNNSFERMYQDFRREREKHTY